MKDPDWTRAMQELRRSSATAPVRSKKKYRRKTRTERRDDDAANRS